MIKFMEISFGKFLEISFYLFIAIIHHMTQMQNKQQENKELVNCFFSHSMRVVYSGTFISLFLIQ